MVAENTTVTPADAGGPAGSEPPQAKRAKTDDDASGSKSAVDKAACEDQSIDKTTSTDAGSPVYVASPPPAMSPSGSDDKVPSLEREPSLDGFGFDNLGSSYSFAMSSPISFPPPSPDVSFDSDKPPTLETLSQSKLKLIAKNRGVSLQGCLEKSDIVTALRAAGVEDNAIKSLGATSSMPPPSPSPSPGPAESSEPSGKRLEDLTLSKLKALARLKAIRVTGCYEKSDVISCLRRGGFGERASEHDLDKARQYEGSSEPPAGQSARSSAPAFPPSSPRDRSPPRYTDAGRMKVEMDMLRRENTKLMRENWALKRRLGIKTTGVTGTPMEPVEKPPGTESGFTCSCGQSIDEDAVFCSRCGKKQGGPAAAAQTQLTPAQIAAKEHLRAQMGGGAGGGGSGGGVAAAPTSKASAAAPGPPPQPIVIEGDNICWANRKGTCRLGSKCQWKH
eukprot:TRINITY_DN64194_c0_g1_i1.p1 TRINITY_DN64194_c0_g1~~TRINITY_DN64194_c0_g1_i1.p1  ORF type:complete len:484 (-),score=82.35 TRINITY_DN64194_c0_g1_i1:293-1639(-)